MEPVQIFLGKFRENLKEFPKEILERFMHSGGLPGVTLEGFSVNSCCKFRERNCRIIYGRMSVKEFLGNLTLQDSLGVEFLGWVYCYGSHRGLSGKFLEIFPGAPVETS